MTKVAETHNQALKRKYEEMTHQKSPYEELFDSLRHKSDEESTEILRRIRAGSDIHTILHQVKDGDLLLQLSSVPEKQRRHELPQRQEHTNVICARRSVSGRLKQ